MSIVRVGLAETKDYSAGWDGVFGGRKKTPRPAKASTKKKSKPTKKKRR